MQATRGKAGRVSQDIEQQNMTVPAKKRTGTSADIAEVSHLSFGRSQGTVVAVSVSQQIAS